MLRSGTVPHRKDDTQRYFRSCTSSACLSKNLNTRREQKPADSPPAEPTVSPPLNLTWTTTIARQREEWLSSLRSSNAQ
ncbi:hypothetical protein DPEC_G00178640 [Dallia pectoralis]|uniref:Uncharacterized protein n=1 Tax=Dallia pectoralis TaxID=75939 RepID=A0ACC2GFA1_DALPE|nr:hypothetical protein DPEC_G00178640 [Dallia pectoralis]